ncbi:hypothetical protein BD289DRAFT_281894 [Coniella lustricola]|uniref:F-box domain-containing protein n=1 Tax=Coniella lustricola TaxID=2025994 RepID=A0A2T3A5Y8_9PEZI|nr:hypothetical protein BD289DRAFT_281894 [Coniella lustricola]
MMAAPSNDAQLLTLPADLLKNITNSLEPADEKHLKQTCKSMKHLINQPQTYQHASSLTTALNGIPPQDGRATPMPQSPLPEHAATTLREIERENEEVEDRERAQGLELSDTEDDFGTGAARAAVVGVRPNKFKGNSKNILRWTTDLDSAPGSPSLMSPYGGSTAQSPRATPSSPGLSEASSFKLTTS